MSELDKILDPFEIVIWQGKPDKKAFLLPNLTGVPIGLAALSVALLFFFMGMPYVEFLLLIVAGFVSFIWIVPNLVQLKRYPNTDYVLTNKRLIIRSEFTKRFAFLSIFDWMAPGRRTWFAKLEDINKLIVKKGRFWDKISGTASIYPITPDYPYMPILYADGESPWSIRFIYNVITEMDDAVTSQDLREKTLHRPRMEALKKPYEIEKLIIEAINEHKKIT